jgi:Spy/CpxP family protein refolding chaperone
MKRTLIVLGIALLVAALAVPVVFAWGPGWGGGHHMRGYWGSGPGYGRGYYGNVTPEQRARLDALDRKFYDETRDLRNKIWTKSRELDSVLSSSNLNPDKAKALLKEISNLRAKLDEKKVGYELEARKVVPDRRFGYGHGHGFGHHMGRYGHMMGYGRGYGPGNCWK